ncbi:hypothetical protein [Spirillospora sp. NPDC047279]|uniref:hypothetical protein n=1 Tax=Spirillospora sp. NPDC047279 TaxID=3155478 RepID=UPI0033CC3609
MLICRQAELDVVDGVPEEDRQLNGGYTMTAEQRVEWEAGVRSLCDGMVRIVVTPAWAEPIDFERLLPSPVEELIRPGRACGLPVGEGGGIVVGRGERQRG